MTTQVIGVGRRSRVHAALVVLALTLAVVVVVAQASSVWSTRPVPPARPAPAPYSLSARELQPPSKGVHLPNGCRVKYGCQGGTTSGRP
jgi:hypothetical protein